MVPNADQGPMPSSANELQPSDCAATDSDADKEARQIGAAVQRAVQRTVAQCLKVAIDPLLAELRDILYALPAEAHHRVGRMMTTAEIAHRLGLAVKTIRRLCTEGKIDASKVGNEWRTTAERLMASPYLRRRRTREGYESP